MAIEAERLLAIFEAKFTALEKALAKAPKDAKKAFGEIEAAGTQAENTLSTIGSRGTPAVDRLSKSLNGTSIQTSNLAAQFNDIGVQLAGGQSPFLIALQQGTQITQALGPTGARGAVAALGGAFMSMLNPVSLATIAVIGLGGIAIQYFASVISEGDKSAEVLKREADLIQQVAARWGDTVPALQEYAEVRRKLAEQAELKEATAIAVAEQWSDVKKRVEEVVPAIADVVIMLQQAGAEDAEIVALQRAFSHLQEATDDQKASAEEAKAVQSALMTLFNTIGIPVTSELAAQFQGLAESIAKASEAADKFKFDEAIKKSEFTPLGSVGPVFSGGGRFIDEAEVQNRRANATKSQFQTEQDRASRRGRRSQPREDEYQRATDAVVARTAALIAETEAQRGLNPLVDDYGFAAERARMERELLTAAEEAGKEITPQLREQIASLAEQYALAGAESARLAKDQRELHRAMEDFQRLGENVLGGFIADLTQGRTAAEALSGALAQVGNRLIEIGLNSLFDNKGGGGFLSSLLGIGGGFKPNTTLAGFLGVPGYAKGTNNHPGGLAIVGEKGPELLNLPSGSQVIPNNMLRNLPSMAEMQRAAGSGGPQVTYAPTYDMRGASVEAVAKLEQMRARDKAEMPAVIIKTIRDAQKRRII